ncbi:unnamed protein product [Ceutorhynchus assimilis]|uniref:Uncharacterized protein n=1 Tax=Ceutorhynchus assimilis TaxID=467358 RepID=A0A9N9M874_9CUCU|nr:unnamed protein product [Ceutorhynchus assimilis]
MGDENFKCCKKDKLTSYYCVGCKLISHKSCIERSKTLKYIKGHRIYCSQKCAKGSNEYSEEDTEELLELQTAISDLRLELSIKNDHIENLNKLKTTCYESALENEQKLKSDIDTLSNKLKFLEETNNKLNKIQIKNNRLKRGSQILSDSVIEQENYRSELEERQKEIQVLNEKIAAYKLLLLEYDENVKFKDENIDKLKSEFEDLQMDSRNLISTIRTLEADNKCLRNELQSFKVDCVDVDFLSSVNKKLGNELLIAMDNHKNDGIESGVEFFRHLDYSLEGVSPEKTKIGAVKYDATTVRANHKLFYPLPLKEVLIYGDYSATNCSISLNKLLNKQEFLVEGWVKSKGTFSAISRSVFDHTRKYGEKDYVVVMLDLNNLSSCCKCDEFFHPSCLVQSAKLKNTQCVHETQQSEPPTSEAVVEVKADINNPYVVENNLLLRIIKEMEEKYDILMENCNLLKEKVSVLKEKVNGFEEKEKQQGVATSVPGKDAFVDISNATAPNASSSSSIESRDGQQGQRVQQHKSGVLYSQKVRNPNETNKNVIVKRQYQDLQNISADTVKSAIAEAITKTKINEINELRLMDNHNEKIEVEREMDSREFNKAKKKSISIYFNEEKDTDEGKTNSEAISIKVDGEKDRNEIEKKMK